MSIKVEDLAASVANELRRYSQNITDGLKKEVKKVSKETVAELRATSPKNTGDYASGWTTTTEYESKQDIRMRIYNQKKPQLTHLLENGHAKVTGGRVQGKPHIEPAERNAEKKLLQRVKVVVKK